MERPKIGTDFWADIIAVDDTDFKTNKDGLVVGGFTFYYAKPGDLSLTVYTLSASVFREVGHVNGQQYYQVKIPAAVNNTLGAWRYFATYSGMIFYPGKFFVRSISEEEEITERAAIKAKTDLLPADPASETNVDANETKIDAVKAKTDNLSSDPTSETNATANKVAIIAEVDANEVKIDALNTAQDINVGGH